MKIYFIIISSLTLVGSSEANGLTSIGLPKYPQCDVKTNSVNKDHEEKNSYNVKNSDPNTHENEQRPHGWVDPFDWGISWGSRSTEDSKSKSDSSRSNTNDNINEKNSDSKNYQIPHKMTPPKPGWIDPFEILSGESNTNLFVYKDVEKHVVEKRLSNCELFAKRFVNLFLNAIKSDDYEISGMKTGKTIKLEFSISSNEMKILSDFGRGLNDGDIEKSSDTLRNVFKRMKKSSKSHYNVDFQDAFIWIQSKLLKILQSPEWMIVSSVCLLLLSTMWFALKHSYRFAFFSLVLMLFLTSFGFTWMRMIEEKEIERFATLERHGDAPYHCRQNQMHWYEHMYYRLLGEDCTQFYQTRDIRTVIKISPLQVLVETVSCVIIQPATHFGNAYGNFISSFTGAMPLWLKPLAVIVGSVVPVMFLIVMLVFLFKFNLSLSLTGFHISPSWLNTSHQLPLQPPPGSTNRYIQEVPHNNTNSANVINNCTEPVFIMNWKGVQQLISSSIFKDGDIVEPTGEKHERSVESLEEKSGMKSIQGNTSIDSESEIKIEKSSDDCETEPEKPSSSAEPTNNQDVISDRTTDNLSKQDKNNS